MESVYLGNSHKFNVNKRKTLQNSTKFYHHDVENL